MKTKFLYVAAAGLLLSSPSMAMIEEINQQTSSIIIKNKQDTPIALGNDEGPKEGIGFNVFYLY